MTSSTIQFISQVKLGELQNQRAQLLDAYDELTKACDGQSPVESLKILFEGLQEIEVASKPLHPELGNIELLLEGTAATDEIIEFWRQKLNTEVASGRLRADIVYLFGALLGEWGGESETKQTFLDERLRTHEVLLQRTTTSNESGQQAQPFLNEIFASFGESLRGAAEMIAENIEDSIEDGDSVDVDLYGIAKNIYLPASIRREAKRFSDDEVLSAQYQDAIRVVTRDLRNWSWPDEGVSTRAVWTRNKWRLYPNLSMVQLSIVAGFSNFWSATFESVYTDAVHLMNRKARYQKLLELNAPAVIIDNEIRMLAQHEKRVDLGWYEVVDPWDGSRTLPDDGRVSGILSKRASEQGGLRTADRRPYYDGYGVNRMIALIHAEVRTLRAAFPDQPLFVVNLDIRDYFASIPHDVILTMLSGLGLSGDDVKVIRRYLEVPYLVDGQIVLARRGVPMDQDLSHWLAEWLLRLMERYVHQHAAVRIIRQIDDICLLSPSATDIVAAWDAVVRFVKNCGLDINDDKSDACAFGAELPKGLPSGPVRWGLLELTASGDWGIHEAAFRTLCETTRQQVSAKHAVLAKATTFNAYLRYLTSAVGLTLNLGDAHRRSANDALRQFERELFGPGTGIVEELRRHISDRYLQDMELGNLPEGWMYWPITAGGLGLRSAMVLCGQCQRAFDERQKIRIEPPQKRPDNWQTGDPDWTRFYDNHFNLLEPASPRESKVMKTLVDDFIARGQEISAGKQQTLSAYWRWILCIYGPEILEKFGTFRFLLTDLVPLQLIHEQLLSNSSLDE